LIYLFYFTKTTLCKITAHLNKLCLLVIKNSGVNQANSCALNTVIKTIVRTIDQILCKGNKKTRFQAMLRVFL